MYALLSQIINLPYRHQALQNYLGFSPVFHIGNLSILGSVQSGC